MIVSTYLKDSNFFGGFYDDDKISSNRELASVMYENQFIKGFWNGTEWIEGATAEEIEQSQKQEKENIVRAFMEKKAQDGQAYASEIRFRITKELIGKPIAEVNEATDDMIVFVYPLLNLIEGIGADYWNAMNEALKMSNPTNGICLKYFNEVKAYIVNYVQTNYPTEL
jgi:hypothetical protein